MIASLNASLELVIGYQNVTRELPKVLREYKLVDLKVIVVSTLCNVEDYIVMT